MAYKDDLVVADTRYQIQQYMEDAVTKHYGSEGFEPHDIDSMTSFIHDNHSDIIKDFGLTGANFKSDAYPNGISGDLDDYQIFLYSANSGSDNKYPDLITIDGPDGKSTEAFWYDYDADLIGKGFSLDLTDAQQVKKAIEGSLDRDNEYQPSVGTNVVKSEDLDMPVLKTSNDYGKSVDNEGMSL